MSDLFYIPRPYIASSSINVVLSINIISYIHIHAEKEIEAMKMEVKRKEKELALAKGQYDEIVKQQNYLELKKQVGSI